jgi:hypothetical protein
MQGPIWTLRSFVISTFAATVAVLSLPFGGPVGAVLVGLGIVISLHRLVGR